MNWGYKIIVVYAVFVIGITFMVFKSSNEKIDLVTEDYYNQELHFQNRIDDVDRANKLSREVSCQQEGRKLTLKFPDEFINKNIEGSILIYFPADKDKDLQKKFTTTQGSYQIDLPKNNIGMHQIQISWNSEGKSYFTENKIFIQ